MPDSALSDVTVLDLSDNVAGAYCGRLLAGFGADVIKVEPPGVGDWARRVGPFPQDIAHPEKSGLFLHLNAGKRSLTLDIERKERRSILRQLAVQFGRNHRDLLAWLHGVDRLGIRRAIAGAESKTW